MTLGKAWTMSIRPVRLLDGSDSVEGTDVVVVPIEADDRSSHMHAAGGAQPGRYIVTNLRMNRNRQGASACA